VTFAIGSLERAQSDRSAGLSSLVWLRSLTACDHPYLESARGTRVVTYGELRRVASRWAALLEDLGVEPGETVALAVSDPVEFACVFLGILASGRVVAPFDPSATEAELTAACARIAPRIVVAERPPPPGAGVEWVIVPPGAGFLSDTPSAALSTPRGGRCGVVLSTSGTTGVPKVIRLDEEQLLHTAGSVAGHLHLSSGDRGFNSLPLFHINAEVVGLLATLVAGATIVLDDRFHRGGFWDTVSRRRVTWINAVPANLARLAVLEPEEMVPEGIRFARSASAPLPVPVLERFERTCGIPVVETYGMTEAASQITANPLHGVRKRGSAGLPVGTEVRVLAGSSPGPACDGEVGRVVIRGQSVIGAYASAGYEDRVDPDGWLETGDLGYLDEDGYLFLVGRADDVINRGGEKIYPKEVEDAILGEPGVEAVAVVGREDEILGSVPVAYLVAEGVSGPTQESLAAVVSRAHERCTRLLSRPKRPVAFHVVARLPQSPTGKVRRSAVTGVPVLHSLLVQ
jgi:acyl-CoA synthetase (AMP-forming)/AMP-acid ligase II